jgi:phage head maturation protease
MTEILARAFTATLAVRDDGDGRTLHGPLLPWGVEARVLDRGRTVVETFQRGALSDVDPGRVPLTATHPRDAGTLPIGVTVELEDRADAAWGAWRVSKTALGDEVLELARDGVPLGLSVGFMEVPGGSRWSPDRRRVTRTRAALDHIAVVRQARLCRSQRAGRTGRPRPGNGYSARHPGPTLQVAMPRTGKGGPTGRPWRRLRARVLAASDLCVLCGHPLAGDVHHIIPRSIRPDLELDPGNVAPAHGALSRCPWCGRACNAEQGDRLDPPAPTQSRRW